MPVQCQVGTEEDLADRERNTHSEQRQYEKVLTDERGYGRVLDQIDTCNQKRAQISQESKTRPAKIN
ncbi:uncharacterized protein RSE6_08202 [Rhynchosporium secalis]|uniref:Uncharacterized protein n=1 Tax=Rhynchosporium secalis TaxID=38038 RepID=A0A1E1MEU8_RHYSE|nr:uncharacterized protein RSE6_08202 [Rhynchosporium secalis]